MKKLYLLRHAKSDYPQNVDDHDRPLNKRGQEASKLIGKYIKENNLIPEKILCSDAVRTSMTAKNITREAGANITISFMKELYLATPGEILKILAKVDDKVNSVMVVCHNPGVEQLAKLLTASGDANSIAQLKTKYPTAGLACFSIDTESWGEINPGSANLDRFVIPRELE
ncbi:MAG: phosphoglycerate mutase protein [Rickettsiaceae bacterium]|jgi:phosphohistidine phosphatase|nr:phosphoglycerate mutase protein [Rickettsiaceae bacterium]